jgi:hypothetical protein
MKIKLALAVMGLTLATRMALPRAAYAQDQEKPVAAPAEPVETKDAEMGMSGLAKDNSTQKKAIDQAYNDKVAALKASADFKALSPADQRAKLKDLRMDRKAAQAKQRADFKAKRQAEGKDRKDDKGARHEEAGEKGEHGERGAHGHSGADGHHEGGAGHEHGKH